MKTILKLYKQRTVNDVQHDFNKAYPYLNIEFYDKVHNMRGPLYKQRMNKSASLRAAGLTEEGELTTSDMMTVGDLENTFRHKFGAVVQVTRKSGSIWLETSMTDNWTLKHQNDHGRELSEPLKRDKDDEIDYD